LDSRLWVLPLEISACRAFKRLEDASALKGCMWRQESRKILLNHDCGVNFLKSLKKISAKKLSTGCPKMLNGVGYLG